MATGYAATLQYQIDMDTTIVEKTISIKKGDLFPRKFRQNIPKNWKEGIYVLWYKTEVVYVGQSKNVTARIREHKNKKWNMISFIPHKDEAERRIKEALLIKYFQPPYNKESRNTESLHKVVIPRVA